MRAGPTRQQSNGAVMSPTVRQTSYRLVCEALRGVLLDVAQGGAPSCCRA